MKFVRIGARHLYAVSLRIGCDYAKKGPGRRKHIEAPIGESGEQIVDGIIQKSR